MDGILRRVGLAILIAAGGTVAVSPQGERAIKASEGNVLTPYQDEAGVWTDGYGNTHGVVPGKAITQAQADAQFKGHVGRYTSAVIDALNPIYALWQGQLDAYVSLTLNIGEGGFRSSTVVKRHKAGDYPGAALAIMRFNKLRDAKTGKLRDSRGLGLRRYREYNDAIASIPIEYWNTSRDRKHK